MPQKNRFMPVIGAVAVADLAPADGQRGGAAEADDRQQAGDDEALVERAHDRAVGAELHEERADDRGDDAGAADGQRIDHACCQTRRRRRRSRQHHGGDDRHRIGLEQVGRHAGAVADIVADVIGDRCRVARIVLGNAGFDLADQVAADIGALGEDAAAETGEDRDQRGAEAERHQRIDDVARSAGRDEPIGPISTSSRRRRRAARGRPPACR